MINYQEIIDNIDDSMVIKLMERLGVTEYIEKNDYLIFPTICHNAQEEEASFKLYYYKNSKLFVCYTECGSFTIFKLLEKYYKINGYEYDWYNDIYKVILDCSNFSPERNSNKYLSLKEKFEKKQQEKELPVYNDLVLQRFTKFYPIEWLTNGISKKTMDKYNILYSISQNKIIIPHYNVKNELVGIRGRALNEEEISLFGKYMPVQIEKKWYKHPLSLNLYGLNYNKENIKKTGVVYLCEGEKSVMQLEDFNLLNCGVAVCGSSFNKFQLKILLKEVQPKEIILCFDNEEKEHSNEYFNKLWNICKKYTNYCNFSFIYDKNKRLGYKESPTDRGEEVFKKLLEERVIVK